MEGRLHWRNQANLYRPSNARPTLALVWACKLFLGETVTRSVPVSLDPTQEQSPNGAWRRLSTDLGECVACLLNVVAKG